MQHLGFATAIFLILWRITKTTFHNKSPISDWQDPLYTQIIFIGSSNNVVRLSTDRFVGKKTKVKQALIGSSQLIFAAATLLFKRHLWLQCLTAQPRPLTECCSSLTEQQPSMGPWEKGSAVRSAACCRGLMQFCAAPRPTLKCESRVGRWREKVCVASENQQIIMWFMLLATMFCTSTVCIELCCILVFIGVFTVVRFCIL